MAILFFFSLFNTKGTKQKRNKNVSLPLNIFIKSLKSQFPPRFLFPFLSLRGNYAIISSPFPRKPEFALTAVFRGILENSFFWIWKLLKRNSLPLPFVQLQTFNQEKKIVFPVPLQMASSMRSHCWLNYSFPATWFSLKLRLTEK